MNFASPGYLVLLALAPMAGAAYWTLARWRTRAGERFAPGGDRAEMGLGGSSALRAAKASLVVLAIALVAIALAGPESGERRVVVRQAGVDVVIALDVSRSMYADDVAPSRIALAQQQTLALLDRLGGHRVGLVIFARDALLRSPLTTDMAPLRALVRSAPRDSVLLEPGSNLGAAVRTALRALESGEAKRKVVVLVSDGEDHERDALAATRDAAARGVLILAAGTGTDAGAPVPAVDPETGLVTAGDEAVEAPFSRRDERLLRLMAAASPGGDYVSGDELAGLADAINGLERTTFGSDEHTTPIDRFQWAALAAFVLLVVERFLPERRGVRWPSLRLAPSSSHAGMLGVMLMLGLLTVACRSDASRLLDDGNRAYERGDYTEALDAYLRAGAESPERPEPHINAGLALHHLERYEEAARETVRALPDDDAVQTARVHYNLGLHYVAQARLLEAFASFRQALLLNPDDRDAKHNLELLLPLIERLPAEETVTGGAGDGDESSGTFGDQDGQVGLEQGTLVEDAQRALAAALAGVDEELTVEEALRALDLADELNRHLQLVSGGRRSGQDDGPDY